MNPCVRSVRLPNRAPPRNEKSGVFRVKLRSEKSHSVRLVSDLFGCSPLTEQIESVPPLVARLGFSPPILLPFQLQPFACDG